ncbi:2,5-dichloro-2,5-cyclohexadiene-1,4-diol dehydrogenase [Myxozyma melibiosi]|uniref:2,5-dichloro-2,5-cyclohexadiene-1,4-diol dehydrogenase n=1 Tax=Myxozyma melibiosi TaxID=54550 RepID=A0ABR1FA36_9ASCO
MSSFSPHFAGKVVLITGAAGGIGRAVTEILLQAGAVVCLGDVDTAGCDAILAPFLEKNRSTKHLVYALDVTASTSVHGFVKAAVFAFGRVDCAFNNAGILSSGKPLAEVDESEYDRVVGINMKGVFLCLQAEIPAMISTAGGGSIVNTTSTLGTVGDKGSVAYIASKHGVVGLTRAAAMDYAESGIRVNALAPGLTETAMTKNWLADAETKNTLLSNIPMKRQAAPAEMVDMVLFLLSDASSYVTGQVMTVDGGMTMH